jgi:hypothetical protein
MDVSGSEGQLHDLLERTRVEISQADNEAAVLLGGSLAAAGVVSAALLSTGWRPLGASSVVSTLFFLAVAATLGGMIHAAAAVYPRRGQLSRHETSRIGYFEDVVAVGSLGALQTALRKQESRYPDVLADQLWRMSLVVTRKYAHIRWTIRWFALAVLTAAALALYSLVA